MNGSITSNLQGQGHAIKGLINKVAHTTHYEDNPNYYFQNYHNREIIILDTSSFIFFLQNSTHYEQKVNKNVSSELNNNENNFKHHRSIMSNKQLGFKISEHFPVPSTISQKFCVYSQMKYNIHQQMQEPPKICSFSQAAYTLNATATEIIIKSASDDNCFLIPKQCRFAHHTELTTSMLC
jgi:hypothetical protein